MRKKTLPVLFIIYNTNKLINEKGGRKNTLESRPVVTKPTGNTHKSIQPYGKPDSCFIVYTQILYYLFYLFKDLFFFIGLSLFIMFFLSEPKWPTWPSGLKLTKPSLGLLWPEAPHTDLQRRTRKNRGSSRRASWDGHVSSGAGRWRGGGEGDGGGSNSWIIIRP